MMPSRVTSVTYINKPSEHYDSQFAPMNSMYPAPVSNYDSFTHRAPAQYIKSTQDSKYAFGSPPTTVSVPHHAPAQYITSAHDSKYAAGSPPTTISIPKEKKVEISDNSRVMRRRKCPPRLSVQELSKGKGPDVLCPSAQAQMVADFEQKQNWLKQFEGLPKETLAQINGTVPAQRVPVFGGGNAPISAEKAYYA